MVTGFSKHDKKWDDIDFILIFARGTDLRSANIFLWCNGNTSDSGSDDRGSSPCGKTQTG